MTRPLETLIAVARKEEPADLVITNARIWNTFTGEFTHGSVAVAGGYIAGVGDYKGRKEIDAHNGYLVPGFVDAHVHIESAMSSPAEFARALVRAGVTTVIADPHEIANVSGVKGIEYILAATQDLPLRVYVMLPSCVPATPLEQSAIQLAAQDLTPFLAHPRVLGLGEMMNFPGVLHRSEDVMRKLRMAESHLIDGHAPGLSGDDLNAYAAAGIRSDHEASSVQEAVDRLSRGMALMLREGSAAADLAALLPAVTPENEQWCMFCTDDRNPCDLATRGSINGMVKMALAAGHPLRRVLRMASYNPARHFGLKDLGAIAPGYLADFALYPNLDSWWPSLVLREGRPAFADGPVDWPAPIVPDAPLRETVRLAEVTPHKLALPALSDKARVIGVTPGRLLTGELILPVPVHNGQFVADAARDILKLSVWERHNNTGLVGVGLVHGMGLKKGAVGSTVAHDSHHLIVAGTNDNDMLTVVRALAETGGGLAVAHEGRITGLLPLPLSGLLSDLPLADICKKLTELNAALHRLGVPEGYDPFMTLAFLSLPVIPSLKLTCNGLVSVERFDFVPVSVMEG